MAKDDLVQMDGKVTDAGAGALYKVRLDNGQTVNLPSLAAAEEYARQSGGVDYTVEQTRPSVLSGTGEQVRDQLDQLQRRFGVEEFVIDAPVADFAARLKSLELLPAADKAAAA